MIVRSVEGFHYLVPQVAHARHSAVLLASLRADLLGPDEERVALLEAVALHDDGWIPWDASPTCDAAGLPVPFDAIPAEEHRTVWLRSMYQALRRRGPRVAALVARHGRALAGAGAAPSMLGQELADSLPHLLARAWPAEPEDARAARLEALYAPLCLADALSLAALSPRDAWEVLLRDGTTLRTRRVGAWTVAVAPWPFAMAALRRVAVECTVVGAGEERAAAAILRDGHQHRLRVLTEYVPEPAP